MATGAAGVDPKTENKVHTVYIIINHRLSNININIKKGRTKMPSREEMIDFITDLVHNASDIKLEQYYWFFQFEDNG